MLRVALISLDVGSCCLPLSYLRLRLFSPCAPAACDPTLSVVFICTSMAMPVEAHVPVLTLPAPLSVALHLRDSGRPSLPCFRFPSRFLGCDRAACMKHAWRSSDPHFAQRCGKLVCGPCSSKKVHLEVSRSGEPKRVCGPCFNSIAAEETPDSPADVRKAVPSTGGGSGAGSDGALVCLVGLCV